MKRFNMDDSETFLAFVTYVEVEGAFVHLWVHKSRKKTIAMEDNLQELSYSFDNGVGKASVQSLYPDLLVCVKYHEMWYRARIIGLENLYKGFVHVFFIDFGNKDQVSIHNIRVLDSVKDTVITRTEDLAVGLIVVGVLMESSKTGLSYLEANVTYKDVKYRVKAQAGLKYFAICEVDKKDLAKTLVNLGYGGEITCAAQLNSYSQFCMSRAIQSTRVLTPAPQVIPAKAAVKEVVHLDPSNLKIGSVHMVYVGCISDEGASSFYVHLASQEKLLAAMMTELNEENLKPLRVKPKPGLECAGNFIDKEPLVFCRAEVLSLEADHCQIQFIDYGSNQFVPYSSLRELPERYKIIKPLSIKCKLNGAIDLPRNSASSKLFQQLVDGKILKMMIVEGEKEGEKRTMYTVKMYDGNESIIEIIRQKLGVVATNYPSIQLKTNSIHQVIVTNVEVEKLPWNFHVQLLDEGDHLDRVMSEVARYCTSTRSSPGAKSYTGEFPIFAFNQLDQKWCRAKVLENYEESIKVQFIDLGNVDEVLAIETRDAKVELVKKLPAQAISCRLQNVDTVKDAAVEFSEISSTKSFEMKVVQQLETGEILVRLFDISLAPKKDIGYELMVKKRNLQAVNLPPTHPYHHQLSKPVPRGSLTLSRPASRASIAVDKEKDWLKQASITLDEPGLPEQRTDPNLRGSKQNRTNELVKAFTKKVHHVGKGDAPAEDWNVPDDSSKDGSINSRKRHNQQEHKKSKDWSADSDDSSSAKKWIHDKYFEVEGVRPLPFPAEIRGEGRTERRGTNAWIDDDDEPVTLAAIVGRSVNVAGIKMPDGQKPALKTPLAIPKPKLRFANLTLQPGSILMATLVSATSPFDFWVQPATSAKQLGILMERIAVLCKSGGIAPSISAEELDPGDACLARYPQDKRWYRAQVESVTKGIAKVRFVDFGNMEEVRVLTEVKAATMELLVLEAQAVQCSLRGAVPATGTKWTSLESKSFLESTLGKTLEVELVAFGSHQEYSVLLCDGTTCLNRQFGASPESLLPRCQLSELPLEPGQPHEVTVCWFLTPANFFVYLEERSMEQELMRRDTQTAEKGPVLQEVEKGALVLARLSGNPNFYRCSVLATREDDRVKLQRLDVGDCQFTDVSRLRALPESLMECPAFAVPCELANVVPSPGPEWPLQCEAINEVFQKFPTFTLTLLKRNEDRLSVSLVAMDGKFNVADELVKRGLAKHVVLTPEESLSPGNSCKVFVSSYDELNFYVHQAACTSELDDMQKTLQQLQLDEAPSATKPGKVAAARSSEDGLWYRVLPLGATTKEGTKTLFVDYGNQDTSSQVKELPAVFMETPPFATECSLAIHPIENGEKLEQEAVTEFEAFVLENSQDILTAKVYSKSEQEVLIVDLINETGESFINKLESKNLAQRMITEAYISSVESPSAFYIQFVEDEEKLEAMEEKLAKEKYENLLNVKAGMMCLAKFPDDQALYRAKVLSVGTQSAKVLFVDYGNTSDAVEFKHIPEDMTSIPALAKLCTLKLKPKTPLELEKFLELANDGTIAYQVVLPVTKESPHQVTLLKNGKDILELIRSENPNDDTCFEEIIEPEEQKFTDIYISHIESPFKFWILKAKDEEMLIEIQVQLMLLEDAEIASFLFEDLLCAAQSKEDNMWYRGRIKSLNPTQVFFYDHGNSGEVLAVKELPQVLKEIPPLAKLVTLKDAPAGPEIMKRVTKYLLKKKETMFQAEFAKAGRAETVITLYENGNNVLEMITKGHWNIKLTDFTISHYISPTEFYIQLISDLQKLENLLLCLAEDENFKDMLLVEEGNICLAKYPEDNLWYRALVTSVDESSTKVFFIDYGNSADVTEFKALPNSLAKIPAMAKQCFVNDFPQSEEGKQNLSAILTNPDFPIFQAEFDDFKEGLPQVINEIYVNGKNIMLLHKDVIERNQVVNMTKEPERSVTPVGTFKPLTSKDFEDDSESEEVETIMEKKQLSPNTENKRKKIAESSLLCESEDTDDVSSARLRKSKEEASFSTDVFYSDEASSEAEDSWKDYDNQTRTPSIDSEKTGTRSPQPAITETVDDFKSTMPEPAQIECEVNENVNADTQIQVKQEEEPEIIMPETFTEPSPHLKIETEPFELPGLEIDEVQICSNNLSLLELDDSNDNTQILKPIIIGSFQSEQQKKVQLNSTETTPNLKNDEAFKEENVKPEPRPRTSLLVSAHQIDLKPTPQPRKVVIDKPESQLEHQISTEALGAECDTSVPIVQELLRNAQDKLHKALGMEIEKEPSEISKENAYAESIGEESDNRYQQRNEEVTEELKFPVNVQTEVEEPASPACVVSERVVEENLDLLDEEVASSSGEMETSQRKDAQDLKTESERQNDDSDSSSKSDEKSTIDLHNISAADFLKQVISANKSDSKIPPEDLVKQILASIKSDE